MKPSAKKAGAAKLGGSWFTSHLETLTRVTATAEEEPRSLNLPEVSTPLPSIAARTDSNAPHGRDDQRAVVFERDETLVEQVGPSSVSVATRSRC
jgi:hypothetical protein